MSAYENHAPPATAKNSAPPLMAEAQRRDIGAGARCNRLTRRSVLWALTEHQRRDDGAAYASTQTLADEAGVSERTVRRCLAEFEAEGLLKRTGRRGFNTVWRIDRAALEALPLTVRPHEARSGGTGNSDRGDRKFGPGGPTEALQEALYIPPYPQGGMGEVASLIGFDEGGEAERPASKPQPPRQAEPNEARGSGSFPAAKHGRTGAPEFSPPKRNYVLTEPEGFDELHSLWANADQLGGARSGRKSALRAYRRALERAEPQRILAAAREYLASPGVKRDAGRYLMRLSRWLGEERWALAATPQVADGEVRRRLLCWQHEGVWLKAWGPAPDEPGGPEPLAVSQAMWQRRVLGWWYRETDWPVRSWGPEPDRPGYQGPPIQRPAGARPERG